jgi:hypothetical protein
MYGSLAIFCNRPSQIRDKFFDHAEPDVAAHGDSEADGSISG